MTVCWLPSTRSSPADRRSDSEVPPSLIRGTALGSVLRNPIVARRRAASTWPLAAAVLAAICLLMSWPAMAGDDGAPLLIVLSWDGVRHDYPERADFPALERMQREGARVRRLIPPWPSSTFPGHVTMATGALANVHGIVDNVFYDRERGEYRYSGDADWIQAEPLWIAAERQGITAATYFWVGSESDWRGQRATYRHTPFDDSAPEADKVDQIVAWIDLPARERPSLIMSYWRGADRVGHDLGPDHPRIVEVMLEQDRELARLQEAIDERDLWSRTTLMIVTDHGMTRVEEYFDLPGFVGQHASVARISGSPVVTHVFLEEPARAAEIAAILGALRGVRAYAAADLPEDVTLDHPTRNGDVIVIAEPPLILRLPALQQRVYFRVMGGWDGRAPGTHGYDPEHPDMAGTLFALGRGVPRGHRIERAHMVDIAATAASLLGIEPPRQSSGTPIFAPAAATFAPAAATFAPAAATFAPAAAIFAPAAAPDEAGTD
jgi:predicted AlkP superfamily pyrophosphatase or phosphodiesterase